jgi:hypothetical protein
LKRRGFRVGIVPVITTGRKEGSKGNKLLSVRVGENKITFRSDKRIVGGKEETL